MASKENSVHKATSDDARVVGELLHEFNTEYGDPTPGIAALAVRMSQLIESGDSIVLLGGEPPEGIAVLRFRLAIWSTGLECYLAELFVRPSSRGHGLGRSLLTASLEIARLQGADDIFLGTNEYDTAARKLYESMGFTNLEGQENGANYFYEREL